RDQVGVHAPAVGVRDELGQVAAQQRFTAGEVHLKHTEVACLIQDASPPVGRQLVPVRAERYRVGAVSTVERAAVGEFGQHPHRDGGAGLCRLFLRGSN